MLLSDSDLRRPGVRAMYLIMVLLLCIGALVQLLPFVWMVLSSLKNPLQIIESPPRFWPDPLTFDAYIRAWEVAALGRYFVNSLMVAAGAVVLEVLVSAMAAFVISKLRPRGWRVLLVMFLSTMMIPGAVLIIPLFMAFRQFPFPNIPFLGIDLPTVSLLHPDVVLLGLVLTSVASGFSILLFKGFFDNLPDELIEAARIDGCSNLGIFFRIVMPLSKPVISVVAIFAFMGTWNAFLFPLIVLSDPQNYTLMVGIYQAARFAPYNVQMAMATMAVVPMILLFLMMQRHIVQGVTFTGIKG